MTDIVALLRETAKYIDGSLYHPEEARTRLEVLADLARAADELEASAEWALCRWLAGNEERSISAIYCDPDSMKWVCEIFGERGCPEGAGSTRADAIRAALKAWEER